MYFMKVTQYQTFERLFPQPSKNTSQNIAKLSDYCLVVTKHSLTQTI